MKYNRSEIMKAAWMLYRMNKKVVEKYRKSFSECLKRAWERAKEEIKAAAESEAKGIRRMHYSEYKTNYSDCQTVEGSYDKRTKTIEVMTKVIKGARRSIASMVNGICPRCHTYCYGDCSFGGKRW